MKITVLQGIPGSGKTTKAETLCKVYPNTVRVNKDLLREMIYFHEKSSKQFNRDLERAISRAEYKLAKLFIQMGYNVVVDDTNLKQKYITKYKILADALACGFEVVKMDTPLEECVKRDRERKDSVGEQVIRDLYSILNGNNNRQIEG